MSVYDLIFIVAIVALLIFIYFTRYVEKKRADRRHEHNARRQELLEQTLAAAEKIKNRNSSNGNEQKRKDQSENG